MMVIRRRLKKIINLISPETIYIAIDGVAPFSKMAQQRERRYKSQLTKTIDDHVRTEMGLEIPNFWDRNAISPGTKFMDSIYERIIIEGANKQCIRHIAEKDIANLSDLSCDFIII